MNNYVYKYVLYAHINGELEKIIGIFGTYDQALKFQYSEDNPYYECDIEEVRYYRFYK